MRYPGIEEALDQEGDAAIQRMQLEGDDGSAEGDEVQVAANFGSIRRVMGKFLKETVRDVETADPAPLNWRMDEAPTANAVKDAVDAPEPAPRARTPQEQVDERLNTALPSEVRVHGGAPHVPGKPVTDAQGARYLDRDLVKPGKARLETTEQINTMWDKAVEETPGMREALDLIERTTGRRGWPKSVEFWNKGLSLPDRARYWYEISAERFREAMPDLSVPELNTFMRLVAATSPQADPHVNLRRAVGTYSQHLQGKPVTMDLTSRTAVGEAIIGDGVSGPKVNNFGDTFQYLQGNNPNPPLSTNDRQVASSFGLDGEDIANNPVLYEGLSRFYINMRNALNEGKITDEAYQTWQIQALGWVQERIEKGNPSNDDYSMALDRIVKDLKAAGIDVPDGKLTTDVLMDPRVAKVMSTTMEEMENRHVATIESITNQTSVGEVTSVLIDAAHTVNDVAAIKQYDNIVHRSLDRLIIRRRDLGKKSVADVVADAVTGRRMYLSRMEKGMGTYEKDISANVRIPLPSDMTQPEREAFLAIMGRGLRQDAAPASTFKPAAPKAAPPEGFVDTYGIFIPANVDDRVLKSLQAALPEGHEISVKQVANGMEVQINPRFGDEGPIGPTHENAIDAIVAVFPPQLAEKMRISKYHFRSDYVSTGDYGAAVSKIREKVLNDEAAKIQHRFKILRTGQKLDDEGARLAAARNFLRDGPSAAATPKAAGHLAGAQGARARYRKRIDTLALAEKEVGKVAKDLNTRQDGWNKKHGEKLMKSIPEQEGIDG